MIPALTAFGTGVTYRHPSGITVQVEVTRPPTGLAAASLLARVIAFAGPYSPDDLDEALFDAIGHWVDVTRAGAEHPAVVPARDVGILRAHLHEWHGHHGHYAWDVDKLIALHDHFHTHGATR